MAFKMKNAGGNFKTMGSSPHKSAFKATPDELREAGVSQGMISGDPMDTRNSADVKKAEDRWSGGNEKASKNTGRSLDSLVKTRKGLEKGSPEYNAIQNEINKSLGDSTRHKQENKTKVDGMTIKKKGDGDDTNIKSTDAEGKKQNIKIRDGEVKGAKAAKVDKPVAKVDKPVAKAPVAEASKGKGKAKVKAAVGKVKNKVKATVGELKKNLASKKVVNKGRKAEAKYAKEYAKKEAAKGKAEGSKAPKGTTYDPSDDTSNMPT